MWTWSLSKKRNGLYSTGREPAKDTHPRILHKHCQLIAHSVPEFHAFWWSFPPQAVQGEVLPLLQQLFLVWYRFIWFLTRKALHQFIQAIHCSDFGLLQRSYSSVKWSLTLHQGKMKVWRQMFRFALRMYKPLCAEEGEKPSKYGNSLLTHPLSIFLSPLHGKCLSVLLLEDMN